VTLSKRVSFGTLVAREGVVLLSFVHIDAKKSFKTSALPISVVSNRLYLFSSALIPLRRDSFLLTCLKNEPVLFSFIIFCSFLISYLRTISLHFFSARLYAEYKLVLCGSARCFRHKHSL